MILLFVDRLICCYKNEVKIWFKRQNSVHLHTIAVRANELKFPAEADDPDVDDAAEFGLTAVPPCCCWCCCLCCCCCCSVNAPLTAPAYPLLAFG